MGEPLGSRQPYLNPLKTNTETYSKIPSAGDLAKLHQQRVAQQNAANKSQYITIPKFNSSAASTPAKINPVDSQQVKDANSGQLPSNAPLPGPTTQMVNDLVDSGFDWESTADDTPTLWFSTTTVDISEEGEAYVAKEMTDYQRQNPGGVSFNDYMKKKTEVESNALQRFPKPPTESPQTIQTLSNLSASTGNYGNISMVQKLIPDAPTLPVSDPSSSRQKNLVTLMLEDFRGEMPEVDWKFPEDPLPAATTTGSTSVFAQSQPEPSPKSQYASISQFGSRSASVRSQPGSSEPTPPQMNTVIVNADNPEVQGGRRKLGRLFKLLHIAKRPPTLETSPLDKAKDNAPAPKTDDIGKFKMKLRGEYRSKGPALQARLAQSINSEFHSHLQGITEDDIERAHSKDNSSPMWKALNYAKNLTNWTKEQILSEKNPDKRELIAKNLFETAWLLFQQGNLQAVQSIIGGLTSGEVYRLQCAKNIRTDPRYKEMLSSTEYRNHEAENLSNSMLKADKPFIPVFTNMLSYFEFRKQVPKGLEQSKSLIKKMNKYLPKNAESPQVTGLTKDIESYADKYSKENQKKTEDENYQISYRLEPR